MQPPGLPLEPHQSCLLLYPLCITVASTLPTYRRRKPASNPSTRVPSTTESSHALRSGRGVHARWRSCSPWIRPPAQCAPSSPACFSPPSRRARWSRSCWLRAATPTRLSRCRSSLIVRLRLQPQLSSRTDRNRRRTGCSGSGSGLHPPPIGAPSPASWAHVSATTRRRRRTHVLVTRAPQRRPRTDHPRVTATTSKDGRRTGTRTGTPRTRRKARRWDKGSRARPVREARREVVSSAVWKDPLHHSCTAGRSRPGSGRGRRASACAAPRAPSRARPGLRYSNGSLLPEAW